MWEMSAIERRYSVPPSTLSDPAGRYRTTEDLHAWSIYRQNLNADFTDSALGTGGDKNQPPFGNFQLRESTVHTILNHPKYGPRERNSELASNVYTYLRFGLPRVFPHGLRQLPRDTSSGYDSSDDGAGGHRVPGSPLSSRRKTRSDPDFRNHIIPHHRERDEMMPHPAVETSFARSERLRLKASSEADLINNDVLSRGSAGSVHRMSRAPSTSHLSAINGGYRTGSNLGLNRAHLTPDGYNSHPMPSVGGGSPGSVLNGGVHERRSNLGSKAGSKTGSKAGSNISLNSRASRQRSNYRAESVINNKLEGFQITDGPLLNDKFFPKDSFYNTLPGGDSEVGIGTGIKHHPHLQVRDLSFEMDMSSAWKRLCGGARTKLRLLEGLNFEVRGGEILAIMATSEMEGTGLLDILANRHRKWRSRLLGEIVVNGLYMSPAKMESCVSYVQKEAEFFLDMSVRQTLLFTTLLREPGNGKSFDTKGRINALLEDLGLGQVKHTRVRDLTESEKRRLNVACHLLMDTDIVLLDQPTKGMDIFDTFFLMEYLRQWASRGRIVIVTIHPPTYEIFTMISRIALISTGRMLYFGKRRDMLPYFAYIDFPCPAYKNPSDYYLDLVTLDNLSSEAMLESSQRVENLVDIFRRRQETLSDPGPPGQPPSGFKTANFFTQILALWIRVLIYMFPFNVIGFVGDAILAAMMSVLVGAIFWNVRLGREQEHVNDRFGFYYALMAIAVWPFLLRIVAKVWREKSLVYKDIREGLYGKAAYLFSKSVYSLPVSAAMIVAYVVPAYSMAGLESTSSSSQVRSYGIYIGYMLLYMFCLRAVASTSAWLCSSRHLAAVLAGFVLTIVFLSSGYAVHLKDLSLILFWTQWVSPARWIGEQLMNYEFNERYEYIFEGEGKYYCSHNPVVQQDTAILVRAECGIKQDPDALKYFGFRDDWSTWQPLVITFAFLLTSLAIGWATFILSTPAARKKRPIRGRFAKI